MKKQVCERNWTEPLQFVAPEDSARVSRGRSRLKDRLPSFLFCTPPITNSEALGV